MYLTKIRSMKKNMVYGIIKVTDYGNGICVEVKFPATPNGCEMEWTYYANELSLANKLKNMTIEELSNKFNLQIFAECL